MSDDEIARLQEEMMIKGFSQILREKGAPAQEYAEAYDAFLDENDLNEFLREKPENVREAFLEALGDDYV